MSYSILIYKYIYHVEIYNMTCDNTIWSGVVLLEGTTCDRAVVHDDGKQVIICYAAVRLYLCASVLLHASTA